MVFTESQRLAEECRKLEQPGTKRNDVVNLAKETVELICKGVGDD